MTLPRLEAIAQLSPPVWQELKARLREADVTTSSVAPLAAIGRGFPEPFRRPLTQWHLRQAPGATALAMRLFVFRDELSEEETDALLGRSLRSCLQEAGLLSRSARGLMCPMDLNVLDDLYLFCDDLLAGKDAVMGAGSSSVISCRAASPLNPVRSVLDLGCGAGTAALAFSGRAPRVIGTDVNPRAVTLARINAALNTIEHVEFVVADLFGAVADEQFDLIVSQPPFIARPSAAPTATFLHGGARGDELPLRLLRDVPRHLNEGGRAVLLIDWPEDGIASVEQRVLAAVGEGLQVLLLRAPGMALDDHCIAYAIGSGSAALGYQGRMTAARDHFATLGITSLTSSVIVLRRATPAWTTVIALAPGAIGRVSSAQIETLLLRECLLAGEESMLLGSRLIIPAGLLFLALLDGRVRAEFPATSLFDRVELNAGAYRLIQLVNGSPTLDDAIAEFSRQADVTRPEALDRVLPAVREALRRGVLEPARN